MNKRNILIWCCAVRPLAPDFGLRCSQHQGYQCLA